MAYSAHTQTYTAWHCKIWSGAENEKTNERKKW